MFLQLDQIRYSASFIALSTDHPLSKEFKDKKDFKNLKKRVIEQGQPRKQWQMPINLDTIQVYK